MFELEEIWNKVVITYATKAYKRSGKALGLSSIDKGADSFMCFSPSQLDSLFIESNYSTLEFDRGAGYWLWKPYIIKKSTEIFSKGSLIMYLDCNVAPLKEFEKYLKMADDQKIHVWAYDNSKIEDWTHPVALELMRVTDKQRKFPMVHAGVIFSRNSELLATMSNLWLKLAENPNILRPDTFPNSVIKPCKDYIWHRHDQSILSVLVSQNPSWFTVHSRGSDGLDEHLYFDVHRNQNIRYLTFLISFPRLREVRRKIISKFPKVIRRKLRIYYFEKKKRKIPTQEANSIKDKLDF